MKTNVLVFWGVVVKFKAFFLLGRSWVFWVWDLRAGHWMDGLGLDWLWFNRMIDPQCVRLSWSIWKLTSMVRGSEIEIIE